MNYHGAQPFSATQPLPALAGSADSSVVQAVDYVAQLEKLGQLRDAGVLTDEEFQSKKVEILRRI